MMHRGWKALALATATLAVSGLAQAKQVICVFDLVGKTVMSIV